MSILVVGSVALDTVKTPAGERVDALGGSATYFSVAARNFTPVSLVAVVGNDFPKQHINMLKKHKVDLDGLEIADGKTFRWSGVYSGDLNDRTTLSTDLNVFAAFEPKLPDNYKKTPFLFLANIDPTLQLNVLKQVKKPKLTACDTMNLWIENKQEELRKLLKSIDIFFLNEPEAKMLTGRGNLFKAAQEIIKMGPKRVIIKKGEHGAILFSSNSVFCLPAYLLDDVVDPTGAGDTFAGGFMGYLAKAGKVTDAVLRNAIAYGTVMATFTVEGFSLDKLAKVTQSDINKRFNNFKKLVSF